MNPASESHGAQPAGPAAADLGAAPFAAAAVAICAGAVALQLLIPVHHLLEGSDVDRLYRMSSVPAWLELLGTQDEHRPGLWVALMHVLFILSGRSLAAPVIFARVCELLLIPAAGWLILRSGNRLAALGAMLNVALLPVVQHQKWDFSDAPLFVLLMVLVLGSYVRIQETPTRIWRTTFGVTLALSFHTSYAAPVLLTAILLDVAGNRPQWERLRRPLLWALLAGLPRLLHALSLVSTELSLPRAADGQRWLVPLLIIGLLVLGHRLPRSRRLLVFGVLAFLGSRLLRIWDYSSAVLPVLGVLLLASLIAPQLPEESARAAVIRRAAALAASLCCAALLVSRVVEAWPRWMERDGSAPPTSGPLLSALETGCLPGIRDLDTCTADSACCSADCAQGRCKPACSWLAAGCDSAVPCCEGFVCAHTGFCCADEGTDCEADTDCCIGSCTGGVCHNSAGEPASRMMCSTQQNGNCDHNATCSFDGGFEECTCKPGSVGNGNVCVAAGDPDLPATATNPCGAEPPPKAFDVRDRMVRVPAGPFWRGCNLAVDPWCVKDELPGKCITLSAFDIDQLEVTQREYADCVAHHACTPSTACSPNYRYAPDRTPDLPVACVSWQQADGYCHWAGNGTKRLPTEAEWEKAARGTDGRIYPWGNENPDTDADPCRLAIYDMCPSREVKVGTTIAGVSPYGALDMAGNVWEWVSDWYDPDYYAVAPTVDPRGPAANPPQVVSSGSFHVYRGGGITDQTTFLRASNRFGGPPGIYDNVGIRCARSIK